jgi:tetratricopeptide (TPR) repeat protein
MRYTRITALVIGIALFRVPAFGQTSREKVDFAYGERLLRERLFDLSAIQFEQFLQEYPSSTQVPRARWLKAQSLFHARRFEEARTEYLRYVLDHPGVPDPDAAQFRIAECFENQGRAAEAAQSYFQVYAMYPQSQLAGEGLVRNARLYAAMDSLDRAESSLRIALGTRLSSETAAKAAFLLSGVYARSERFDEAIHLLEPLAAKPVRDNDAFEASMAIGGVLEATGDWEKARLCFASVTGSKAPDSLKQAAWAHLGELSSILDETEPAVQAFRQSAALAGNPELNQAALERIGRLEYGRGRFQAALDALQSMRSSGIGAQDQGSAFWKARCLEALGRREEAEEGYRLASSTSSDASVRRMALLASANLLARAGRFGESISEYDRFLALHPDDPLTDRVLLRKSTIAIDSMRVPDEAFPALRQVLRLRPGNPSVAEAMLLYAKALAVTGRLDEAVQFYLRVIREYPGSAWAMTAEDRKFELEAFSAKAGPAFLEFIARMLENRAEGNTEAAQVFALGSFSFSDLKSYEHAIRFYRRFLALESDASRKDSALFQIGLSFDRLALRSGSAALLDSANRAYADLLERYPQSPFVPVASLSIPLNALAMYPLASFTASRVWIFPPDPSEASLRLWKRALWLAAKRDSTQAESRICDLLLSGELEPSDRFECLFRKGILAFRAKEFGAADSFFTECVRIPFMHGPTGLRRLRVQTAAALGRTDEAIRRLAEWEQEESPPSPADTVLVEFGNLRLAHGFFKQSVETFELALEMDSVRAVAASMGLLDPYRSQRRAILRGLAAAYASLRDPSRAKKTFLLYGRENPDPAERGWMWMSLSGVAEAQGRDAEACYYLGRAVDAFPSDTAHAALGLLNFRLGRYEQAIAALAKAAGMAFSENRKAFYESRSIVSLFRLNRIAEGEARMKRFEAAFKNLPSFRDAWTEFGLERGRAYFRDKSFDQAMKCYEEVEGNKKSLLAPEAELETARVYLVTNKTEKALDILTGMASKYAGQPVVSRVYLNLGDHYYRSNQFDNAMLAFKKAMDDTSNLEVFSDAQRYLIRVYQALQLPDAALAMARDYLRRFPDAEDAFQKKIQIGINYQELKEYDRAIDQFRRLRTVADAENQAEIQYWIGKTYYQMGQFASAVHEFIKVKYQCPPTTLPWASTALYEAGLAYLRLHKPSEARQMFEKIVQTEGATSDLGRIARQRIDAIDAGRDAVL